MLPRSCKARHARLSRGVVVRPSCCRAEGDHQAQTAITNAYKGVSSGGLQPGHRLIQCAEVAQYRTGDFLNQVLGLFRVDRLAASGGTSRRRPGFVQIRDVPFDLVLEAGLGGERFGLFRGSPRSLPL